jgi:hypothetical protein
MTLGQRPGWIPPPNWNFKGTKGSRRHGCLTMEMTFSEIILPLPRVQSKTGVYFGNPGGHSDF